jgi:hypothetical protein
MPEINDKSESRLLKIIYLTQVIAFAIGVWNYTH